MRRRREPPRRTMAIGQPSPRAVLVPEHQRFAVVAVTRQIPGEIESRSTHHFGPRTGSGGATRSRRTRPARGAEAITVNDDPQDRQTSSQNCSRSRSTSHTAIRVSDGRCLWAGARTCAMKRVRFARANCSADGVHSGCSSVTTEQGLMDESRCRNPRCVVRGSRRFWARRRPALLIPRSPPPPPPPRAPPPHTARCSTPRGRSPRRVRRHHRRRHVHLVRRRCRLDRAR